MDSQEGRATGTPPSAPWIARATGWPARARLRRPAQAGRDRPSNQADGARPGGTRPLGRAIGSLRDHRRDAFGSFLSLLVVTAANLVAPQFIRIAVDRGMAHRQASMVVFAVGGLIGVAVVRGLFTFFQGYLAERASQGVAYDLRNALFERIERLSFSYYDRVQTGQLVTRLTNDVEQIRQFAGTGVVQLGASAIMLIGSAVLLFTINWRLTLAVLTIMPCIFTLLTFFVRHIGPLFGQVQQALGRLNSILQEDLAGMRVIRAFTREEYEVQRYRTVNETLLARNLQTIRMFSNNFPFIFFFANMGTVMIIWYGGSQVMDGQLSIGSLIAFNTYLTYLLMPILTIAFLAAGISRAARKAIVKIGMSR